MIEFTATGKVGEGGQKKDIRRKEERVGDWPRKEEMKYSRMYRHPAL